MNGSAAILQAARDGDVSAVERLLSDDPGLVNAAGDQRKAPLHWAAERNHPEVPRMLLDAGADLEATTAWGATPLDWAGGVQPARFDASGRLSGLWDLVRAAARAFRSYYPRPMDFPAGPGSFSLKNRPS